MKLPNKLIVKQEKEMFEIFTGFETKNKYSILDENQKKILYAFEESDGFSRFFLRALRALDLKFIDDDKQTILTLKKSFAFMFPELKVIKEGLEIASIKKRFTVLKNRFDILYNSQNYECSSSVMHPWTFNIIKNNSQIAQIQKKWGGIGQEMFTDADNFSVDLTKVEDDFKWVILALSLAIDLTVFENKGRRRN